MRIPPTKVGSMDKVKEAFMAGFTAGSTEQYEQDFPDVGFRFNKSAEEYWEEYKKEERSETGNGI